MAKDPICGMTVDESSPVRVERDGQTFYFCSEHCRQKFLGQTPTKTTPLTLESAASDCCGGAKAKPAGGSGNSCGGKEVHAPNEHSHHEHAAVKPSAAAKYFCPMCPGVESDKPGDCPKCGMALERNPAWVATATGQTI